MRWALKGEGLWAYFFVVLVFFYALEVSNWIACEGVIFRRQEGRLSLFRSFCRSYSPSVRLRKEAIM